jgi:diguanylate cyclase (GGDEF)-like protein
VRWSSAAATSPSRRALEEELTRRAFGDSLTGLANPALFRDRLAHAVARQQRGNTSITLLLIDLDNFKTVNDTLGHSAGDELLITVAGRLSAQVRPADTLARLGGDEFAILVEDLDADAASALAQRIIAGVRQPVQAGTQDVICTMSVGIAAVQAGDPITAEELLRNADLAMYAAKRSGRDGYTVFDPAMHEDVLREAQLRAELEAALIAEEFFLQYQPIVDLPSGQLTGVEALVRWQHPTDGVVGPDTFIPVAEETGLIVPLGRWVLNQACHQLARWYRSMPAAEHMRMSVNVSARQLQNPGFVSELADAITSAGIDPTSIILEITESLFLDDTEPVLATLWGVHDLGVRVAIDDFGTGYSALSYLQKFPVDILKIDRSLVSGTQTGGREADLAGAVIQMGRALRLQTVAEGIETCDQSVALRDLGYDFGQGFHFARPVDANSIEGLLTRSASARAPVAESRECVDIVDTGQEQTIDDVDAVV